MKSWKLTALGLAVLATSAAANAAFTDLDTSFGKSGLVTLTDPATSTIADVFDGAEGSDNLLYLLVGKQEVARLSTAGAVDTTFGAAGFLTLAGVSNPAAIAVSVTAQKIYVAGRSSAGLASVYAFDFTGKAIPTFGTAGVASLTSVGTSGIVTGLEVLSNGNVLVDGGIFSSSTALFAAELTATGLPVNGFGTSGVATASMPANTPGLGSSIQPYKATTDTSGRVYVAGGSAGTVGLIVRFTAAGALDSSFGTKGILAQSLGSSATFAEFELASIDASGNVIALGGSSPDLAALDTFTGSGALVTTVTGTDSNLPYTPNYAQQTDGKFLLFGGAQASQTKATPNVVRLVGTSTAAGGSSSSSSSSSSGSSSSSSSSSSSGSSSSSSSSSSGSSSSSSSSSSGSSSSGSGSSSGGTSGNSSGGGAFSPLLTLSLLGFAALRRKLLNL